MNLSYVLSKQIRGSFFLWMLLISASAIALEAPTGSKFDARIQRVHYNEHDVVEINAYPGIATQIMFAPEEEVLDIASGFSEGWEFVNRRNHLYLKPKSAHGKSGTAIEPFSGQWDTNLIVTTNLRVYSFDLVLHRENFPADQKENETSLNPQESKKEKIAYRIAFYYPEEAAEKARLALEEKEIAQRLSDDVPKNWHYSIQMGKNSKEIAPLSAYDDGRFTYFQFPGNREFPAVFVVSSDQSESLVNSHIDPTHPDVLVVQRVAPEFILRLGNEVAAVYNDRYDPIGVDTSNGTSTNGVERTLRQGNSHG